MVKKVKKAKKEIATTQAIWFGIFLLGQVTGILVGTALLGWLVDDVFNTQPIGLGAGVVLGSLWATTTVVFKVKRELA